MANAEGFSRSMFLAVDAWRYSRRDDLRQAELQDAILTALATAAARAGLDRSRWQRQSTGDGELAMLPADEPEPRVVDDFVRELNRYLDYYNRIRIPSARLRLRVALHYGGHYPGGNGFAGRAPVDVSRLLDSQVVRHALAANDDANLALIVSAQIFNDIVRQGHTSLRTEDFVRVVARDEAKGFEEPAWIRVPGVDPRRLADPFRLVLGLHTDGALEELRRTMAEHLGDDGYEVREQAGCLLAMVAPEVPEARVLGAWIEKLRRALRDRVQVGIARGDAASACTLAMSDTARRTLDAAPAHRLVVTVSDDVYRSVVLQGGNNIHPDSYQRSARHTWVCVPGFSTPPKPSTVDARPTVPATHKTSIADVSNSHVAGSINVGTESNYFGGARA